jgi:parallel beta-helix repeat protein
MGRNRLVTTIVVCVFIFSTLFLVNPLQMTNVKAVTHAHIPSGAGNNTTAEDAAGAPYDSGPSGDFEVIWSPLNNPHIIEDNYTVEMGWTLIIEQGCDIRIDPDIRLIVHGGLIADGGILGITFSSNRFPKTPGDWSGIYIDGGFLNSMINCDLGYSKNGVYFSNNGMLGGGIQDSSIHHNSNYGIYMDFVMGGPWVSRNDIYNCNYGVYSRSSSLQLNANNVFNNSYGVYLGIVPGMGPIGPSLTQNNITNNKVDGVHVAGEMPSIQQNYISHNDQHGVYIEDDPSVIFPWSWLQDNFLEDNIMAGIWVQGTVTNIMNNTIMNGTYGIYANGSADIWVEDSRIEKNGVNGEGISFQNSFGNITTTTISFGRRGIYSNNSFFNVTNSVIGNWGTNGVFAQGGSQIYMENSTMLSPAGSSFTIEQDSHVTTLNTTFDKQSVICDLLSNLTVKWWVHIKVNESDGDPAKGALVWLNNTFGANVFQGMTDTQGFIRWIKVTEYIQGFGGIDYDPHFAAAINGSEYGVSFADIDSYMVIYIDLGVIKDFQVSLIPGWNMISIPLNQSNTSLGEVLKSIVGNYKAVQWFNATDLQDHWKHNLVGKPFGNDLFDLHHRMGMWIYMYSPDTLLVQGDLLPTTDTPLYTGWNFVGYPSLTTRTVADALSSIAGQYDAVWYYNASDSADHWKGDNDGDLTEMKAGEGYFIHATQDTMWTLDGI